MPVQFPPVVSAQPPTLGWNIRFHTFHGYPTCPLSQDGHSFTHLHLADVYSWGITQFSGAPFFCSLFQSMTLGDSFLLATLPL